MLLGGTISLHSSGFPKLASYSITNEDQLTSVFGRGSYETWWLMERLIEDSRVTRMGSEEWCSYATEQRTAAMRAKNPNPIIKEITATIRSIAVCTLIHIKFSATTRSPLLA
ncbi:hypothetical protein DY000_02023426 [Brassica cretica]|uniref:Uncharacterized protein n=1 Tax=Brassica cretica TaxID=69181 RepID=A0ABQ7EHX9_BRACR|nr:hypothetical protein DY000_02023426 [Brassica cretica]